jgi:hypothetical protein
MGEEVTLGAARKPDKILWLSEALADGMGRSNLSKVMKLNFLGWLTIEETASAVDTSAQTIRCKLNHILVWSANGFWVWR